MAQKSLWDVESDPLFAKAMYSNCQKRFLNHMNPDGATNANQLYENGQQSDWYIEAQQLGYSAIAAGLVHHDRECVEGGFKMFDWGFSKMAPDGEFTGTAKGVVTEMFHSASFFVEAVAHSILLIRQSPDGSQYEGRVRRYIPLLHKAARWMLSPDVFEKGSRNNMRFTHRSFLVGAALGEAGLVCDDSRLVDASRQMIELGISQQRPSGEDPEKGGPDSSYQMVGLSYAQYWLTSFPNDPEASKLAEVVDNGLKWEEGRMDKQTGEISDEGNTRTSGGAQDRSHQKKHVAYTMVFRGFAWRGIVTGDARWTRDAEKVAEFARFIKEA